MTHRPNDPKAETYWLDTNWVPKEPRENLAFRKWIRHWVGTDPERQQLVRSACCHDPLFWIETFGWVHEPRGRIVRRRPLILYPHQREFVIELYQRRGERDIGVRKTRGQGGTWAAEHIIYHCLEFEEEVVMMMLSRVADMVDKKNSQDSLFWKLRYIREKQPPWLRSPVYDVDMLMKNLINGSTVIGCASVADAGRGGRHFLDLIDEAAAWPIKDSHDLLGNLDAVSECMCLLSTPKGVGGAFDRKVMCDYPRMKVITLAWIDHPEQKRGLYRKFNGKVDFIDREFWSTITVGWIRKRYGETEDEVAYIQFPPQAKDSDPAYLHYPFVEEPDPPWDGLRSPWYDYHVNRIDNPILRAQELDIQRHKSADVIFDVDRLENVLKISPKPAVAVGNLRFDATYFSILSQVKQRTAASDDKATQFKMPKFVVEGMGYWQLWCNLDERGRPPPAPYVIAADISLGAGASNSCLAVINAKERTKIARYRNPLADPNDLAQVAFAAGIWFGCGEHEDESLIIWEKQGAGITFGKCMVQWGYSNLYRHRKHEKPGEPLEKQVGWPSSQPGKAHLFRQYKSVLFAGQYSNPDVESLEELRQYHWAPGDIVLFIPLVYIDTKSDAAAPHGDLAITDCLGTRGMMDLLPDIRDSEEQFDYVEGVGEAPVNSPAGRRQQHLKRVNDRKKEHDYW